MLSTLDIVVVYCAAIILCHSSVMQVFGTPYGAPIQACESMTPSHNGQLPSNDENPFETLLDEVEIFSNQSLVVTVQSKATFLTSFKGFLVMGFDIETDLVVGTFRILPGGTASQTLDCFGIYDSAATHTSNSQKDMVELEWIPPNDYEGQVIFRTTYVQSYQMFWVKKSSRIVKVTRSLMANPSTVDPNLTTQKVPLPDIYDGCGISKSCIATPDNCLASRSCSMMTSYKQVDDHLEMEILGRVANDEYTAIGFSLDNQMGMDSVIECVFNRNLAASYQSFNYPERDNQRQQSQPEFRLLRAIYSEGSIYCQVEHPTNYVINNVNFNLTQPHYLFMATGPAGQSKISRHKLVEKTRETVDLLSDQSTISYTTVNSRVLKQLHGSLMVTAWLIAASVGVMMSRYMKKTWIDRRFMGKDLWFVYHFILMTTTWILTVAGFIIIFVDVGGWVPESISENPHPLIGCITMVLAFIQPFMAGLRPLPTAPNRYIFNWAHMLVGYSAHSLAITCIFLAVEIEAAQLPKETYWILGVHVFCYLGVHLVLTFLARKKTTALGLSKDGSNVDEQSSFLRKAILVTYTLIVISLGITIIVHR